MNVDEYKEIIRQSTGDMKGMKYLKQVEKTQIQLDQDKLNKHIRSVSFQDSPKYIIIKAAVSGENIEIIDQADSKEMTFDMNRSNRTPYDVKMFGSNLSETVRDSIEMRR